MITKHSFYMDKDFSRSKPFHFNWQLIESLYLTVCFTVTKFNQKDRQKFNSNQMLLQNSHIQIQCIWNCTFIVINPSVELNRGIDNREIKTSHIIRENANHILFRAYGFRRISRLHLDCPKNVVVFGLNKFKSNVWLAF